MATTFTLNYSGQEINNKLAQVDTLATESLSKTDAANTYLAKTVDNMEFIQSSNGLGIKHYGTVSIRPATNSSSSSTIFIENGTSSSDKVYFLSNGIRYTGSAGANWATVRYSDIETKTSASTTYLSKTDATTTYLAKEVSPWKYSQTSDGFRIGRNRTDPALGPVDEYMELEMRPTDDTDATGVGLTQLPTLQLSTTLIDNPNYSDEYDVYAYINALGIKTIRGVEGSETINYIPFKNIVNSTNLKTINGQTLLGSGNIQVAADVESIPNSEIEALFNPPTLISFTIESTTYQAESGMTWTAWCDSAYNTNGFKVSASSVYTADSQYVIARGLFFVNASDAILADTAYNYMTNGGGGTND